MNIYIIPILLLICNIIFFIISLIPIINRKINRIIKTTMICVSFICLVITTSALYNMYNIYNLENLKVNNDKINYVIYNTGLILICYGLYSLFISSIVKQRLISMSTSILFVIGSLCFLIHSIKKTGSYSTSTISNILFVIGCLLFLVSELLNNKYLYFISIGWFIIIISRLILLTSSYLYNNIELYELVK